MSFFNKEKSKILIIYMKDTCIINTIFEHVNSINSSNTSFENSLEFNYIDALEITNDFDEKYLNQYDAIGIHYSVRLPYNQVPEKLVEFLSSYKGLSFLFLQDEYNNTFRAHYFIKRMKIKIVFTCVPKNNIEKIYPKDDFKNTKFLNVLTGYIDKNNFPNFNSIIPPSQRDIFVSYRGRSLPLWYGELGLAKREVGSLVRAYAKNKNYKVDISNADEDRIYGQNWYHFLMTGKASLATDSGSNYFDWYGFAESKMPNFLDKFPKNSDFLANSFFINNREINNCMNQISPKVFECISLRTSLILLEGSFSNILKPYEHFIPLKKDYSNLELVFNLLEDNDFVDKVTLNAYVDIVLSGKYSYNSFSNMVCEELNLELERIEYKRKSNFLTSFAKSRKITKKPLR